MSIDIVDKTSKELNIQIMLGAKPHKEDKDDR